MSFTHVHLPQEDYEALLGERDRLRQKLQFADVRIACLGSLLDRALAYVPNPVANEIRDTLERIP